VDGGIERLIEIHDVAEVNFFKIPTGKVKVALPVISPSSYIYSSFKSLS
jgi:hypothetical protein